MLCRARLWARWSLARGVRSRVSQYAQLVGVLVHPRHSELRYDVRCRVNDTRAHDQNQRLSIIAQTGLLDGGGTTRER